MADPKKVLPSSEDYFGMTQRVLNVLLGDAVAGDSVAHLAELAASLATTSGMVRQQEMVVQASRDARDILSQLPALPPVGGNYH